MSTFSGLLEEIPHISVDRFDGINLESQLFFLSHCHMDHMVGLETLQKTLYTSRISAVIVRKKFPHIKKIVSLDFGWPTELKYKSPSGDGEELSVVVTALSAGHCPGAVMLQFQTSTVNVLYTGDFRLKKIDLERLKPLKLMSDSRSCDAVYVDSTFFSNQWPEFPPQKDSIAKIIDLIQSWVKISKNHVVELCPPATYGSERLFQEIYKALNRPIHVNSTVYEQYRYIPEMDGVVMANRSLQIHACYGDEKKACLKDKKAEFIRVIRPSALIWRFWKTGQSIVERVPASLKSLEVFRVCYSNHASLSEIQDLLRFLKAKKVYLNVENKASVDEMLALKDEIQREYSVETVDDVIYRPFNEATGLNSSHRLTTRIYNENLELDEEFVVALPKRRKRINV